MLNNCCSTLRALLGMRADNKDAVHLPFPTPKVGIPMRKLIFVTACSLAAIVTACSLAGCSNLTSDEALAVGAAIATAPAIATATCDALTKQTAHTTKCINTAGAVITFGEALAAAVPFKAGKNGK